MLTLNGVPTEVYQDAVFKGDVEFQGAILQTTHGDVTWENDVVCYEGEVVTYTNTG